MLVLEGYYDGENVKTIEKIHARKNEQGNDPPALMPPSQPPSCP